MTGRYVDQAGAPVRGTVTFSPDQFLLNAGESVVLVDAPVTVTLDATGSFAVDLATTNDPDVDPNGWTWTLTPNFDGAFPLTFALPSNLGPTVDLTVLAPALPIPDPVYSYVLTSAVGAPTGVAPLNSNATIDPVFLGDESITEAKIDSGAQVTGKALLADGSGGAAWGDATPNQDAFSSFLLMGA